jgi:hypothetical protein
MLKISRVKWIHQNHGPDKQKGRVLKDPAFLFIWLSKMPLFSRSDIFARFGSPAEKMHAHPRN